jgi:hypothetical protein
MKIEAELTPEESKALLFVMGYATGVIITNLGDEELAKACVRISNKLFANYPNYVPYEENSVLPLRRITTQ